MESNPKLFNYENLAFFGRVNASISHELKNIMAIISETAGLLSDLSHMARKGGTIELEILTDNTESIIEEIQRGFATIRQMNRFSHSIDTPVVSVDLRQILDLVSHLCGYLSFAGKIQIHPVQEDAPLVMTSPFILQTIIYETMVCIFRQAGSKAVLDLLIKPADHAWLIIIKGFKNCDGAANADIRRMAASIGVSIHCKSSSDQFEIKVPVSSQMLGSGPGSGKE